MKQYENIGEQKNLIMEIQKEILFKGGNAYIWKKEPKV